MIKIRLEFLSWIAETLEIEGSDNSQRFELNIEEGNTVKDLLLHIATKYPRFERSVFDINLQKLNEKVCIFYNNCSLEWGMD